MRFTLAAAAFFCLLLQPAICPAAEPTAPVAHSAPAILMTRAAATLNGVFSPRGFFNILVPLGDISGVRAAKLDLKISRITIDFEPGTPVTQAEIRNVMVKAGYKPGPVRIEQVAESSQAETGPGWLMIRHPQSGNAFVRWMKINF